MNNYFKPTSKFTSNEEIYHFDMKGKLEKTEEFTAPVCPQCHRYEHAFNFGKITVWCCANASCIEQRLSNAGVQSRVYPINFIAHLKKRNQFASAELDIEGNCVDFSEKWKMLREGKIKDIIVSGPMGVGKTYCMYAALKDVCKNAPQLTSLFLTETELYEKIKNTWDKDSLVSEEEMIKKVSSVDFLFLDDVGSASRTNKGDWSKQIMLDILDERLNSLNLRTIISTNCDIEKFAETYDSRISDRINFMKRAFIKGESRRKEFEIKEPSPKNASNSNNNGHRLNDLGSSL